MPALSRQTAGTLDTGAARCDNAAPPHEQRGRAAEIGEYPLRRCTVKRLSLVKLAAVGLAAGAAWLIFVPHSAGAPLPAPAGQSTAGTDVGSLLTPLLIASTGIERVLEMFWNWVESVGGWIASLLGTAGSWVHLAQDDVNTSQRALNDLVVKARQVERKPAGGPAVDMTALNQQIDAANQTLVNAQTRLRDALASPSYVQLKQSLSVILGLILGPITTFATGLDMFRLLGITVTPAWVALLVTGFIIGTGSGPVHSLIGLIQQSRDAADQAANLFHSRSLQSGSQVYAALLSAKQEADAASRALGAATPEAAPAPPPVTIEELRTIERIATR